MSLAAVTLLVLLAPQDDVHSLIRRLQEDDIEAREAAFTALVSMGEKAREPLKRAVAKAEPDLRRKIEAILNAIDVVADHAKWIPPKPRVSLSGEMTLQEVAKAIEAAGGPKVRCEVWPDDRLSLDLKDAPIWEALEEACRASGKVSLSCGLGGPTLLRERSAPASFAHLDDLRLQADDVAKGPNLQFSIHVGWSGTKAPLLGFVAVQKATDDLGNDVTEILKAHRESRSTPPPDAPVMRISIPGRGWPDEKATRLVSLKGVLTLYYAAADKPMSLRLDVPKEEAATTVQVVDEHLSEIETWPVSFRLVVRAKDAFSCSVQFERLDERLSRNLNWDWMVRDKKGKTYAGSVERTQQSRFGRSYTLTFPGVTDEIDLVRIEYFLTKRIIRRTIPFELKDIRIR